MTAFRSKIKFDLIIMIEIILDKTSFDIFNIVIFNNDGSYLIY